VLILIYFSSFQPSSSTLISRTAANIPLLVLKVSWERTVPTVSLRNSAYLTENGYLHCASGNFWVRNVGHGL